jgi:hypothetical protein
MMKDYSDTLVMATGRNRIRSPKRKASGADSDLFSVTRLMWKTVSAMLLVTLVIGISSTIWYGRQVRQALDHIGSSREANSLLQRKNQLLTVKRDLLLTRDSMEAAVQKFGLRVPADNQVRYR